MRIDPQSKMRHEEESRAMKMFDKVIAEFKEVSNIENQVDLSFVLRNALDTALVADRIASR